MAFPAWSAVGEGQRPRVVQLLRAAAGSAVLRGRQHELHGRYEQALAAGLARRRHLAEPDDVALTAAAIVQALVARAVLAWVADDDLDRPAAIARQFALARDAGRA
ncbi:MAG: hypothetical protein ABW122_12770 [Ilumatobacteraceae bacterium]